MLECVSFFWIEMNIHIWSGLIVVFCAFCAVIDLYRVGLFVAALLQSLLNAIRLIRKISYGIDHWDVKKNKKNNNNKLSILYSFCKEKYLRDRIVVVQLRSAITIHRIKSYNIRTWQRFIHGKHNLTFFSLLISRPLIICIWPGLHNARDPDQSLAAAAPQQINA